MSKKEIRYSVEEVTKTIVDLALKEKVGIVSNRLIYEIVTGLRNYSKKRCESLKLVLRVIAIRREYEVDGIKYILQPYSPMLASRFNFYCGRHEPENFIWGKPVAGFNVFRQGD